MLRVGVKYVSASHGRSLRVPLMRKLPALAEHNVQTPWIEFAPQVSPVGGHNGMAGEPALSRTEVVFVGVIPTHEIISSETVFDRPTNVMQVKDEPWRRFLDCQITTGHQANQRSVFSIDQPCLSTYRRVVFP